MLRPFKESEHGRRMVGASSEHRRHIPREEQGQGAFSRIKKGPVLYFTGNPSGAWILSGEAVCYKQVPPGGGWVPMVESGLQVGTGVKWASGLQVGQRIIMRSIRSLQDDKASVLLVGGRLRALSIRSDSYRILAALGMTRLGAEWDKSRLKMKGWETVMRLSAIGLFTHY